MLTVALLAAAGGFVYGHEPQRDTIEVSVTGQPGALPRGMTAGTVVETSGGRIRLDTAAGPQEFALPSDVRVEELQPVEPSALRPGAPVLVGAERSDYGVALTGIVTIETAR